MDRESAQVTVMRVVERLRAKRRVADAGVEVPGRNDHILQAAVDVRGCRVKMTGNLGRQRVQLNGGDVAR